MERSRDVGDAEDAKSSLVRGAMVPRRNDLLVNQSKIDGTPVSESKDGRHLMWKGIAFWM